MASLQGDCVVLVRNLSPKTSEEALKTFLSTVGVLVHVAFGKDSLTGEPTGNAHCAFENKTFASKAISDLDGKALDGQTLQISDVPKSHLVLNVGTKSSPDPRPLDSQPQSHTIIQSPVKLSLFTGDPKPKGGEVSFEVWKQEVKCLKSDEGCSPNSLSRLVRRSLRGEAGQLVMNMSVDVGVDEIVRKLEGFYGTVESGAVLLQQLYSMRQCPDENITTFSARLQLAVDKAELRSGIPSSTKDETLRVVFWKGLSDERLKQAIRHKYDSVGSFDELIRVARLAEQESADFRQFHESPQRPKQKVGFHAAQVKSDEKSPLEKEVKELKQKLKEMETSMSAPQTSRPRVPNGPCYNCGRHGHYARECRAPRSQPQPPYSHQSYAPPSFAPQFESIPPLMSQGAHYDQSLNGNGPLPRGGQ